MSTTGRIRLLLVTLVALIAAVAATGAAASPPIAASGTFTYTSSTFNSIREVGGNLIIDLSATVSYTGTFTGTSTLHGGTLILHANGTANFQDVETFTGTVNGVAGTATFRLQGRTDQAGVITATDVIVSASGELAGIHGVLSEVATLEAAGPVGTYSGEIVTG